MTLPADYGHPATMAGMQAQMLSDCGQGGGVGRMLPHPRGSIPEGCRSLPHAARLLLFVS